MTFDDFLRGVLAAAAAVRHREVALDFRQRACTTIHDFADLAITDSVAETDVHGESSPAKMCPHLNTNANDCQLTERSRDRETDSP